MATGVEIGVGEGVGIGVGVGVGVATGEITVARFAEIVFVFLGLLNSKKMAAERTLKIMTAAIGANPFWFRSFIGSILVIPAKAGIHTNNLFI